jgi:hypothetical protein
MSNRSLTKLAFGIAIVLTICGICRVWIYKGVPPGRIAVWYPLMLIFWLPWWGKALLCSLQFPFFAAAFSIGIKRWKVIPTLCLILFSCVAAAFAMIESRR